MGNPRWPQRNHEKVQMLVSLQPTKIKTCMICAFVCFLTKGIQLQHYLVRKTVRSRSNPKWPAKTVNISHMFIYGVQASMLNH